MVGCFSNVEHCCSVLERDDLGGMGKSSVGVDASFVSMISRDWAMELLFGYGTMAECMDCMACTLSSSSCDTVLTLLTIRVRTRSDVGVG